MFDLFSLIAGIIIGVVGTVEYRHLRYLSYSTKWLWRSFTSVIGSIAITALAIYILYKVLQAFSKR